MTSQNICSQYPIHQFNRGSTIKKLPESLWNVDQPPSTLYIRGSDRALELLDQLPEWGLAIVGTRSPQPRSMAQVRSIIRHLRGTHLIIISGLARGIDSVAHGSAIQVGLPTIAVLGCGVDIHYPAENKSLMEKILQSDGLIVSEYLPGELPKPYHFIRRNRIIAGWAKATWIVEAGFKSGALNTAKWARDAHRRCYATPCYPGDQALGGNQVLIDRDAAEPLWDLHSLGSTWLELSTHQKPSRPKASHQVPLTPLTDEQILAKRVTELTIERGGAQVSDLLEWCVSRGWSPQKFFVSLRESIQTRLILDEQGVLIGPEE